MTSSYLLNPQFFSSWLPARPDPAHADLRDRSRSRARPLLRAHPRDARVDARRGARPAQHAHRPGAHRHARERARRASRTASTPAAPSSSRSPSRASSRVSRARCSCISSAPSTSPTSRPMPRCACSRWWWSAGSGRCRARSRARSTCRASTGSCPPEWSFLATGAGMLLVLMLLPGGLGGAIGDGRDAALRWFARRRGIRVPSLARRHAGATEPELGNPDAGSDDESTSPDANPRRRSRAGDGGADADEGPRCRLRQSCGRTSRARRASTSASSPAATPCSRRSCCSGSTPSTSSTAPRSACSFPTSATRSVSPTRASSPYRAHAARRSAPRDPARVLRRPPAPRAHRRARRRGLGDLRDRHRSVGHGLDAVDRAQWFGHGASGRHPDAQLVALRLLPIEKRADVSASTASATAVGSFVGAFVGGVLAFWFGWRTPFFVFFVPTLVFVVPRAAAQEPAGATSNAKPRGASGRDRDRRSPTVVRGIGAHPLAGPHAPAHLVFAAVPRGVGDRPRHAHLALLRAGLPPHRGGHEVSSPRPNPRRSSA